MEAQIDPRKLNNSYIVSLITNIIILTHLLPQVINM